MLSVLTRKKGATRQEIIQACLDADERAGVKNRAKPDSSVYSFMYFLRKGTTKHGTFDIHSRKDDKRGTVFSAVPHEGPGEGESYVVED